MCKEPHPCGCPKLVAPEGTIIEALRKVRSGEARRQDVTMYNAVVKVYSVGLDIIRIDVHYSLPASEDPK